MGGVLLGSALWLLSGLFTVIPAGGRVVIVCCISVGAVFRDARVIECRLPQNARQIPRTVFLAGSVQGAAFFGWQLGAGVFTYVCSSAPYVAAVAVLILAPSYASALIAGAMFGFARGLIPLLRAASRQRSTWDDILRQRHDSIALGSALGCAVAAGIVAWSSQL
jgi:hypothetical protein